MLTGILVFLAVMVFLPWLLNLLFDWNPSNYTRRSKK